MGEGVGFSDFMSVVAAELRLDLGDCVPELALADVGLDSIHMLEICVLMEEFGAEIPEDAVRHVVTFGDLFDQFCGRTGGVLRRRSVSGE